MEKDNNFKLKSEGKCLYCDETFTKVGIHKHLQKHLKDKIAYNKPGQSFLIKAEPNPRWGSTPYFLSLWINGETWMEEVDQFLRDIWLECCGHMSAFTYSKNRKNTGEKFDFLRAEELLKAGKGKEYEEMMDDLNGEVPFSRKAKKAFYEGLQLRYQYDFGSTTELLITVIAEYPVKADDPIVLLSRNEPPKLICEHCGKAAATQTCSVCCGYEDEGLFCEECAQEHAETCGAFEEYAAMPVLNSPRMGVCGYGGGRIDTARDGVFKG